MVEYNQTIERLSNLMKCGNFWQLQQKRQTWFVERSKLICVQIKQKKLTKAWIEVFSITFWKYFKCIVYYNEPAETLRGETEAIKEYHFISQNSSLLLLVTFTLIKVDKFWFGRSHLLSLRAISFKSQYNFWKNTNSFSKIKFPGQLTVFTRLRIKATSQYYLFKNI